MIQSIIAKFVITAFCLCNICVGPYKETSIGTTPSPMFTAACDTSVLPIGTIFKVHGSPALEGSDFMCQTVGGAIKGKRIDIYWGDETKHRDALRFGIQELKVEVVHVPNDKTLGLKREETDRWLCPMVRLRKRSPLKAGIGIVAGAVAGDIVRGRTLRTPKQVIMR